MPQFAGTSVQIRERRRVDWWIRENARNLPSDPSDFIFQPGQVVRHRVILRRRVFHPAATVLQDSTKPRERARLYQRAPLGVTRFYFFLRFFFRDCLAAFRLATADGERRACD